MLNEDNQSDDKNYIYGLVVLILIFIDIGLNFSWYDVYFKRGEKTIATWMILGMLAVNLIITVLITITDPCPGDYLTNRNYICMGLYLIYDVWLVFALIIVFVRNRNKVVTG